MVGKQKTLIEIDSETKQTLDSLKIHPDESYDKVILRVLRVVTPEQLSKGSCGPRALLYRSWPALSGSK